MFPRWFSLSTQEVRPALAPFLFYSMPGQTATSPGTNDGTIHWLVCSHYILSLHLTPDFLLLAFPQRSLALPHYSSFLHSFLFSPLSSNILLQSSHAHSTWPLCCPPLPLIGIFSPDQGKPACPLKQCEKDLMMSHCGSGLIKHTLPPTFPTFIPTASTQTRAQISSPCYEVTLIDLV